MKWRKKRKILLFLLPELRVWGISRTFLSSFSRSFAPFSQANSQFECTIKLRAACRTLLAYNRAFFHCFVCIYTFRCHNKKWISWALTALFTQWKWISIQGALLYGVWGGIKQQPAISPRVEVENVRWKTIEISRSKRELRAETESFVSTEDGQSCARDKKNRKQQNFQVGACCSVRRLSPDNNKKFFLYFFFHNLYAGAPRKLIYQIINWKQLKCHELKIRDFTFLCHFRGRVMNEISPKQKNCIYILLLLTLARKSWKIFTHYISTTQ